MDFGFAKDQDLIRKSAREFFDKECPKDKVRELKVDPKGYDPAMWKKMVDLGFTGLVIPEQYGGTEGEYLDLMIFMEEMGRNIVPAPYFATVVLCGLPVQEFGSEAQKKQILTNIAEKGQIWTFALTETDVSYEPADIRCTATLQGDQYVLSGTKLFVPYANVAEGMLVAARTGKEKNEADGVTVFVVDAKAPGIGVTVIPTTARDMRCEVTFDGVKVPESAILGKPDKGWEIVEFLLQRATVLKCAEVSGGAQAALEITTKYARERVQFDRPIGSYQAVQHKLVNLLTEVEGLKYLVYEAAWHINIGQPSPMLSSVAKAKANKVYHRVCFDGIYLHGAIGFTEEMDIGLYHLRTKAYEYDMGAADLHLDRIATELEKQTPPFLTLWN